MANVARPPLPASSERRTRLTLSPAAAPEDISRTAHNNNTTVSTRRSSRGTSLLALGGDEKSVKQAANTPVQAAPPARTNPRKRPAPDDATSDARPPTKIIVTQPHGELLRTTNGVSAPLGIDADDVPSARSTPRPGSAGKLTPATGGSSQDKRSLRSHDGGSRLKSDLATYFSSYDDIIAGVPKPEEFLDFDTPIYLVDEPVKAKTSADTTRASMSPTRSRKRIASLPHVDDPTTSIEPSQPSTEYTYIHRDPLRYETVALGLSNLPADDPLADSHYFTQHRRAERKEKQLRNIEKERAMHEKVQLERLLDGLQGPDWLKVMGITGVTDGERKDWEPKRDYFVREVEALVDKFRVWKEEEKRLRAEKEAALHAQEESSEAEDEEEGESDTTTVGASDHRSRDRDRDPKPPVPRRPPRPHGFLLPFIPPEPTAPFQSFYAKPHLRAAALGKHRHGRNATAFGLPIPEFEEHEFALPEDFVDPQVLRDNARQRRRRKRESAADAGAKNV